MKVEPWTHLHKTDSNFLFVETQRNSIEQYLPFRVRGSLLEQAEIVQFSTR